MRRKSRPHRILRKLGPSASSRDRCSPVHRRHQVAHVEELKGRASGSPELDKAAQYIAKEFHKAGLRPLCSSYLQPFAVSVKATMGPENRFAYTLNGHLTELKRGRKLHSIQFSSIRSVRARSCSQDTESLRQSITTTTMPDVDAAAKSCFSFDTSLRSSRITASSKAAFTPSTPNCSARR